MKRVVFFGILCLLISCLSVNYFVCYAQVNAAIWIDSTNKNADTLDYDILFYKDSPKILNFYIENLGKGDIWIKNDQAPNFVLAEDKANSGQFREFNPDNITFPFTISQNSKPKVFPIKFEPENNTIGDYKLGIKTAKIQFTLSNVEASDTTTYTRYFYVRGWKTKDFLAKRDTLINFDSVLVDEYNPPTQWTLKNVSKTNVTVSKNTLDTYLDSSAITISPDTKKIVNPDSRYTINIDYQPKKLGLDSAKVTTYYSPNIDNVADSNSVIIKGFGVKQEALISRLSQGKSGIPIDIDPDFRGINVNDINLGTTDTVEVVLENTGNIPIHAILKLKEFAAEGPSYSSVDTGRIIIIPANSKTAKITLLVQPQQRGILNCILELHTDIRSRVRNYPSDSVIRFYIRGRGTAPILKIINPNIEFTNTLYTTSQDPLCKAGSVTKQIRITNVGNVDLIVSSPTLSSSITNRDYDVSPISQITIAPKDTQNYEVRYTPKNDSENISFDTLIFVSNSLNINSSKQKQIDTILLRGSSIVPENISLTIGNVKSAPSKKVFIPIKIDSGSESLIYSSSFKTSILYDNSYAFRFDTVNTEGTATANSNIFITKKQIGSSSQIELEITSKNNAFIENPVLANLVFDTYIAEPDKVNIIFMKKDSSKFGRGDCPNFFKVNPPISGTFTLDSVCGQGYKGIHTALGGFTFDVYQAMNQTDQALIQCFSPYDIPGKIIICSVQGEEVREVYDGQMKSNEHKSIPFATEFLAPGIYYCIFRAGIYTSCKPLIINR
jgi:hypothetical protein